MKYTILFIIFTALLLSSLASATGPDCVECHRDTNTTTDANYTQNITFTNTSGVVHQDLNDATGTSFNFSNQRCWACHLDGTEPAGDSLHTDGRNTSKGCYDAGCHVTVLTEIETGYENSTGGYAMMDDNLTMAPYASNMTHKRDTLISEDGYDVYPYDTKGDNYARHANPNASGSWPGDASGSARNSTDVCLNCHSLYISEPRYPDACGESCHDLWRYEPRPSTHNLSTPACSDCHSQGRSQNHKWSGEWYDDTLVPPKDYHNVSGNVSGFLGSTETYIEWMINNSAHSSLTWDGSAPKNQTGCLVCHTNVSFTISAVDESIAITDYSGKHTWNSQPDCTKCHNISGTRTANESISISGHSFFTTLSEGNNSECMDSCHAGDETPFAGLLVPLTRGHAHDVQANNYCNFTFSNVSVNPVNITDLETSVASITVTDYDGTISTVYANIGGVNYSAVNVAGNMWNYTYSPPSTGVKPVLFYAQDNFGCWNSTDPSLNINVTAGILTPATVTVTSLIAGSSGNQALDTNITGASWSSTSLIGTDWDFSESVSAWTIFVGFIVILVVIVLITLVIKSVQFDSSISPKHIITVSIMCLVVVLLFALAPVIGSIFIDSAGTSAYGTATLSLTGTSQVGETVTIGSETYTMSNSASAFLVDISGGTTPILTAAGLVAEINTNSTLISAV